MKKRELKASVHLMIILIIISIVAQKSYVNNNSNYEYSINHVYEENDIRIYKGTPVWALAKALYLEDIDEAQSIINENPHFIRYTDPKYDISLAQYLVKKGKLESIILLVEHGLDPNTIVDDWKGDISLFTYFVSLMDLELDQNFDSLTKFSTKYKTKEEYLEILIAHSADPNFTSINEPYGGHIEYRTPLKEAIYKNELSVVKVLVENGADINYKDEFGISAIVVALRWADVSRKDIDTGILDYLVFEKNGDLSGSSSYTVSERENEVYNENVQILRSWIVDLDSNGYQIKQRYIEKFKEFGQDYSKTPIEEYHLRDIKKRYPDNWEEYIERY